MEKKKKSIRTRAKTSKQLLLQTDQENITDGTTISNVDPSKEGFKVL